MRLLSAGTKRKLLGPDTGDKRGPAPHGRVSHPRRSNAGFHRFCQLEKDDNNNQYE